MEKTLEVIEDLLKKDRERVVKALNEGKIDNTLLNKILKKFELNTRLERIMEMYDGD